MSNFIIEPNEKFNLGTFTFKLSNTITVPIAEWEAMKLDAERLNFMLNNGARVGSFSTQEATKYRLEANGIASEWADSPRAAIDQAIQSTVDEKREKDK